MEKDIMRQVFAILGVCFFLGCQQGDGHGECSSTQKVKKPNIIYILTDQWRTSSLGYAGNPDIKTPHLDKFAQESVNFINAVSVTPVCTPHRAALLTGRFPTTTGMIVNDIYLPSEELTMAEIYKEAGYNTAYYGKWHLDGHGRQNNVLAERRQGFDYWKALECSHAYNKMAYYDNDDPEMKYWEGYSPFAITEDVKKYLTNHANDSDPFLLFLAIGTPHYPHESAPRKYKQMYPKDSLTIPPNVRPELHERTRLELQGYYAHGTATDEAIGGVLAKIKELGLWDNSIIVFSADHGEMMGAHGVKPFVKQLAWDESIRVPFLVRYPSIDNNEGAVVNAPLTTPDVLPSLLSLSELEIPESIQGDDLSELMQNPNPQTDRTALVMNAAPFGANYFDPEYRGIRTKQYTYVSTLEGGALLFDNLRDRFQMDNLINNPDYKKLQEDLDKKLKVELAEIGDEFKSREYYMEKWGLEFDMSRRAINWWDNTDGCMVQSPMAATNSKKNLNQ
ncbi:sulfatase family protein [Reichenbachiella ulvae]|uniref:Sulfatase n=1 Tax=Reichenbachiella ulvae TaxID=2980104 RepID=A0ABT3CSU5_9BACT|nr:sulfatase [Reichenbachiella ulvae]MCV9386656.1 sulfatase [Reichenbachiella ulvae]